MPLSFADAIGNLFNRLGKLGLLLKQVRTYQDAQLTNMTDTTSGVVGQFNGESDIQAIMGSSYIGLLDAGGSNILGVAQNIAQATVNRMVFRDSARLNQTLQTSNTTASLIEMIRQMKVAGASVLAMTVTATPQTVTGQPGPQFTGTGDGIIVASVKRALDGATLENSFAETLTVTCDNDSYLGGATVANEGFSITGTGQQTNLSAFNWPLGSNAQTSLSAIDGNSDNSAGNILTNSSFEKWTANVPDNFELVTGTAGTDIAREGGIIYDGTYSAKITGDGSTLTQIRQKFDDSTGTSGTLEPLTQYAFNIFVRRDGTAAAAGVLTVDLADSGGNVLKDMAGNDNSFTIDLTNLTTSFAAYNGTFRTPIIMPSSLYLRLRLSTALTTGRSVYFDRAALGLMTQSTNFGPYAAVFSGAAAFVLGDYAKVAITNSRGAGGTLSTWQTLFARLFPNDMYGNGLLLPSSSTPTISDNLIG